jgi:hypothetical protein
MTLTLSKWGLGSPARLPKLQSSIARVKTPRLDALFISLESYRSVDVENGLCMSHLDIFSTSYGKKKGHESNWQFDSRPLKVGKSTQLRCVQVECDTLLESSQGELQVFFRPHPNQRSEQKVMNAQSPGSPSRDGFGTPPWESRDKKPFGCRCHGVTQRILYGRRWWLPSSPSRGESCESRVARGLS